MLNERVYQLKPVVRSTRGLIFSLRKPKAAPRTQVSRQLETPGSLKERLLAHTGESWPASFFVTVETHDDWCCGGGDNLTQSRGSYLGKNQWMQHQIIDFKCSSLKCFPMQNDGNGQSFGTSSIC